LSHAGPSLAGPPATASIHRLPAETLLLRGALLLPLDGAGGHVCFPSAARTCLRPACALRPARAVVEVTVQQVVLADPEASSTACWSCEHSLAALRPELLLELAPSGANQPDHWPATSAHLVIDDPLRVAERAPARTLQVPALRLRRAAGLHQVRDGRRSAVDACAVMMGRNGGGSLVRWSVCVVW
jgi:hypothetical protein